MDPQTIEQIAQDACAQALFDYDTSDVPTSLTDDASQNMDDLFGSDLENALLELGEAMLDSETNVPNPLIQPAKKAKRTDRRMNKQTDTNTDHELQSELHSELPPTTHVMHNNVLVTNPALTEMFYTSSQNAFSDTFADDDLLRQTFRNVDFDHTQSGHAPARTACHVFKLLSVVSKMHNIPLNQLMWECGSLESHKCQAMVYNKRTKEEGQCGAVCVAGEFFCAAHKKSHTFDQGLSAFIAKRSV